MSYNANTNTYDSTVAPVYSATTTIVPTAGPVHRVNVTNTSAFTITTGGNPPVAGTVDLIIEITNGSGGVMGTLTWGSMFKLAGAFTNPANGKRRTITFYYDGTYWVETARAAADI